MKHEYSTQQIEEASDLASNGYTRIGINFLLDFLHHLPEPVSDDWQECTSSELRPGDRYRVAGLNFAYESDMFLGRIKATPLDHTFAEIDDNNFMKLYRIPAPVQHPDPEVHRYILDEDGDLWAWSRSHRCYIETDTTVRAAPAEIDWPWTPAEVKSKVVEDDR